MVYNATMPWKKKIMQPLACVAVSTTPPLLPEPSRPLSTTIQYQLDLAEAYTYDASPKRKPKHVQKKTGKLTNVFMLICLREWI